VSARARSEASGAALALPADQVRGASRQSGGDCGEEEEQNARHRHFEPAAGELLERAVRSRVAGLTLRALGVQLAAHRDASRSRAVSSARALNCLSSKSSRSSTVELTVPVYRRSGQDLGHRRAIRSQHDRGLRIPLGNLTLRHPDICTLSLKPHVILSLAGWRGSY
jgi:hypothetical protein